MINEAIILAGGLGTRLKSTIGIKPKPMALISGKPFMEILIEKLLDEGFNHIILSLGYHSDLIYDHFSKKTSKINISFITEHKKLDTGGAIRLAMTKAKEPQVLVMNGDSFLDFNLNSISYPLKESNDPIICGIDIDDTSRYGRIDHKESIVTRFSEKGISGAGTISAGVYIFPTNIFNNYPVNTPFSLEHDFFAKIARNEKFRIVIENRYFIDIGTPDSYARAQIEIPEKFPHFFS
ncbi:sugar phosphate nucleotidyltransferase [Endozoicomonas atrinae]|uniref:sugar phosphate nucleotidyltransferase n=1 Tax=Endozoicomonas atrinae TaxID=1333660 RepID=UPI000827110F|nr:sugar phosphate nucleotidyltransferase [Endozoicomonas atrinae]